MVVDPSRSFLSVLAVEFFVPLIAVPG
jgi:hypothetical protein